MLVGRGTVRTVERCRVQLTMQIDHVDPDSLGEWAFAVLDGLYVAPHVAEADVTAALARGRIEYELYVTAADLEEAVHRATTALRTAVESAGPGGPIGLGDALAAEMTRSSQRAEVSRLPVPA
jgi:hypothetical protein